MKFHYSANINIIVASIILILMFVNQDTIHKIVRLHEHKYFLYKNKIIDKKSKKKIMKLEDVIDIIENYYSNNLSTLKYKKKNIYIKLNSIKSIDISNYVVIIVTVIITAYTAFYSLAGSIDINGLFQKIDRVNSIHQQIVDESTSSSKNEDKIKTLNDEHNKAIQDVEHQKEVLKSNFSLDNDLFQIVIYLIAFILNIVIIQIIVNYLYDARNCFRMLQLQVIEDIENDIQERDKKNNESFLNKINESLYKADKVLEISQHSIIEANKKIEKINVFNNKKTS